MKIRYFLIPTLLLFVSSLLGDSITFTGNGNDENWHNPQNWDLNRIPNISDDVVINGAHVVNVTDSAACQSIVLSATSLLTLEGALVLEIRRGHPSTGIGLDNSGVISISDNADLQLFEIAKIGLLNRGDLVLDITGTLSFRSFVNQQYYAEAGILNQGTITNHGSILTRLIVFFDFIPLIRTTILNEGTLINHGIIDILDGTVKNIENALIRNNGQFFIFDNIIGEDNLVNEGQITNQTGGTLSVNGCDNSNIITNESDANFTSSGLVIRKEFINHGLTRLDKELIILENATLENNGSLEVLADINIEIANVKITGVLENKANALCSFAVTDVHVLGPGELINDGRLQFGNNVEAFFILENHGKITNKGIIDAFYARHVELFSTRKHAFFNKQSGIIDNHGDIITTPISGIVEPDTFLINAGTFNNLVGSNININHSDGLSVGIYNMNTFNNDGKIQIGIANQPVNTGITNVGHFKNEAAGSISIDNSLITGVENKSDATFENIGADLILGQHVLCQQFGITNEGRFENQNLGALLSDISFRNTGDDAIVNKANADFINDGPLHIGENGTIGRSGILNRGSFLNGEEGDVLIENFGAGFAQPVNAGISNEGNINNNGKIEIINANNDYLGLQNRVGAGFTNNPCALFTTPLALENDGLITNSGFWETTQPDRVHTNGGNIINNGILEDPFGSFDDIGLFGNSIINNSFLINGGVVEENETTVKESFQIGQSLPQSYSFGGSFSDELFNNANQDIGKFDIFEQIVLDAPLPFGEHELIFQVVDANLGCQTEITYFLDVITEFSCALTPTGATNGNDNGSISTAIQGGTAPYTFTWDTPNLIEPTTQNLTDQPTGTFQLTAEDGFGETAECETSISMTSDSPDCGDITISWDGGVSHNPDGTVMKDDDNNIIFFGDGVSWNDPLNWKGDRLPNANDVVVSSLELFDLPQNRKHILLNVDAVVKSIDLVGLKSVGLTIPLGRTLTVECLFECAIFENSGDLIVTAGTAFLGNADFVNNGTIDVTGIGSDDVILQITQVNSKVNNGIINVNNLTREGIGLIAGGMENHGLINIENAAQAIIGSILNRSDGRIDIDNVGGAIGADYENEGEIFIDNATSGIVNSFHNKQGGRIFIDNAGTCITVERQATFTNDGFLKLGSPVQGFQGDLEIGIKNEGTFINNDTLIIDGFTTAGILNEGNFAALPNEEVAAHFTNEVLGYLELNGKVDQRGRPIPVRGINNLEAMFVNRNDLFIKDVKTVGIENKGIREGFNDIAGDLFRNEGTITLNFIGVNHNKPGAKAIHNRTAGKFINENEILIGTFKGDFSNGGKIKGVGIYCDVDHRFSSQDSSYFINNKLIKIDNIIQGGQLNGQPTGHGLMIHQQTGRFANMDTVFLNKGPNPFGSGELLIGGHKSIAGSGIFMKGGINGVKGRGVNENGGIIRINQTTSHGLQIIGKDNLLAQFDNDGLLEVGNQITIGGSGMILKNSEWNNGENAEININATDGNGVEVISDTDANVIFDALFNNEGTVRIGNASTVNGNGIVVKTVDQDNDDQRAEFRNKEGGIVFIDRCGESGISLNTGVNIEDGHVEFENRGMVQIGQNTPDQVPLGGAGLEVTSANYTSFTPQIGEAELLIDRILFHGIQVDEGTVDLKGKVDIGVNSIIGSNGIQITDASSRVFSSAVLKIHNVGDNGVLIEEGEMRNNSDMEIDGIGKHGIVVDRAEFFNNKMLTIDGADLDGIHMKGSDARIDNNDLIRIGEEPVGGHGFFASSGGSFNNREKLEIVGALEAGIENDASFFNFGDEALVLIQNADTGLVNFRTFNTSKVGGQLVIENAQIGIINNRIGPAFANITNSGTIRVTKDNPMGSDLCLQNINGGFMTNNGCGHLQFFEQIQNVNSTLRNFGFLTFGEVNTPEFIVNEGILENKGVIEDLQRRLDANSLTLNDDIILHSLCVGDDQTGILNDAVVRGNNVNFSMGQWTVNGFGNGSYDAITNSVTFANPIPNNELTATFTITNDGSNCSIDAKQRIDFRDLFIDLVANAGDDQLDLCNGTTLLTAQPAPSGATGTWNIIQNPDGQGSIADPNDALSEFTGTGGQVYVLRWTVNTNCGAGADEVTVSFAPDADGDGVCDAEDVCDKGDDNIDEDDNNIADACDCNDDDLQIPDFPIEQGTFQTTGSITSTGKVSIENGVTFQANQTIELGQGFTIDQGANFTAIKDDCSQN